MLPEPTHTSKISDFCVHKKLCYYDPANICTLYFLKIMY